MANATVTPATNNTSNTNRVATENGDIITRLMPINTRCSWISPASFKPELVPEELMASNLRVSVYSSLLIRD